MLLFFTNHYLIALGYEKESLRNVREASQKFDLTKVLPISQRIHTKFSKKKKKKKGRREKHGY